MRYKKQHGTDANQQQIVEALRAAGYFVVDLSQVGGGVPDLLVNSYSRTVLLEVKNMDGKGDELTEAEAEFHAAYRGELHIVRSVEDALKAMGVWGGGA